MSEDDVNAVVEFTNRVLAASGLDLKAALEQSDDVLKVQVRGSDVALLLGHNAELLTLSKPGQSLARPAAGKICERVRLGSSRLT